MSKIDEEFISNLVESFYQKVRDDELLGPVFASRIDGDWEEHLSTMKRFWESVVLRTGSYSGRPVPKHQALQEIQPVHFQRWLALFRETIIELTRDIEVIKIFEERANRIASSLQMAIFGDRKIRKRIYSSS